MASHGRERPAPKCGNVAGLQAGLAPNPVTHRNRVDLSGGDPAARRSVSGIAQSRAERHRCVSPGYGSGVEGGPAR